VWHATGFAQLEAMLAAIRSAQRSIRLEIYIFNDTEIGRKFIEALAQAAARGVRVWVLIDAVGSLGLRRDLFAEMLAAGGELRWFNSYRPASYFFRNHRKMLTVDGTDAYVTGCNISTEYHGDGVEQGWMDAGVMVTGPVAAVLTEEFDLQWLRASPTEGRLMKRTKMGPVSCGTEGEVIALFMKPGFGRNPFRAALRVDLKRAKEVDIIAAYFLPSQRLRRHLMGAARRGANVRLLLAGKSDVHLMQLASRSLYRRLIRGGVKIHEYQPQVLHAKVIVLDDIVYVGSSNLDPRSLHINFEVMLRIRNHALAAQVRQRFDEDVAQRATLVTIESLKRGRGWWKRLKQRLAFWLLARFDSELAVRKLRAWRQRREARKKS
jgi:cardiolipin synthase